MRSYKQHVTLLLLTAFLFANTGFAEPEIIIQTRHFPVSGHDSASIRQSIEKNGPVGKNGTRYHAHTVKDINWNYRWIESNSTCRLTQLNVSIKIEYLLPQLQNPENLDETLRHRWDNYYQKLFQHEQQHKEYGVKAARELEQTLESIQQMSCFRLEKRLNEDADRILDKYDVLEREYDRKTNHGVKQGVVLP